MTTFENKKEQTLWTRSAIPVQKNVIAPIVALIGANQHVLFFSVQDLLLILSLFKSEKDFSEFILIFLEMTTFVMR